MNWLDEQYLHLRREFNRLALSEDSIEFDPLKQFDIWLNDAICLGIEEPAAMVLSTVSDGMAHSRVMLLKALDENGFYFFTNYNSSKGHQIDKYPQASLLFFWSALERQVRVEGIIEKVSDSISDEYFYSRPLESRISAMISDQSKMISDRKGLDEAFEKARIAYEHGELKVIRPANWGGYCLKPVLIEFWQGRVNRLHDRIVYIRNDNNWKVVRKAP